jgi:hypothetical protein
MREAMHMRPMPQVGWRTALQDHRLGDDPRHAIDVKAGDRVVMSIVSATQQSLADGLDDGRLMFGGVRAGQDGSYPTHACPGYEAAIGAMLGSLAGLLGWAGAGLHELRPASGPFSFVLEGAAPRLHAVAAPQADRPAPASLPQGGGKLIMAWGDSWLDFPRDFNPAQSVVDIRDWLEKFGYVIPETYCKYSIWPKSGTMAGRTGPFCSDLDARLLSTVTPVAILLSAGGNDSTGDALRRILWQACNLVDRLPYDPVALTAHIDMIRRNYLTVIGAIGAVLDQHQIPVPILVHGYDHPVPRGKGMLGLDYAKKWLFRPFHDTAGLDYEKRPEDLQVAVHTMARLIDALNEMLEDLASKSEGRVIYVDLRKLLSTSDDPDQDDWADDLHPKAGAFGRLAVRIHEVVQEIADRKKTAAAAAVAAAAAAATAVQ